MINDIIVKTKIIFIVLFSFSFCLLFGQEEISWKCLDLKMNRDFISSYQDKLFELSDDVDPSDLPNLEDTLVIFINRTDQKDIIEIIAKGPSGSKELKNDIFNSNPELLQRLKSRRYEWDDLSWRNFTILGRNIFKFADFKDIRDQFWWTRNLFETSPFLYDNAFKVRPFDLIALMFKQGYEEIGYPSKMSRNSNFIISTEATQLIINLPLEPRNISLGTFHPLETTVGAGFKFDVNKIGGMISYHRIDNMKYDKAFDPENIVFLNWSGLIYYSWSFILKPNESEKSKDTKRRLPIIGQGIQRVKAGVSMARLNYGNIDSTSEFTLLDQTDFGSSFRFYFRWEYVSDLIQPEGIYNRYHLWKMYFQANWGQNGSVNFGLLRSFTPNVQLGLNVAWSEELAFLEGDQNEYIWNPGFVYGPNISVKW